MEAALINLRTQFDDFLHVSNLFVSILYEVCRGNIISFIGDNDSNFDSEMAAVHGQLLCFHGSANAVCARTTSYSGAAHPRGSSGSVS